MNSGTTSTELNDMLVDFTNYVNAFYGDYDDNLVLYFLRNDELKSCQLESIIDANYEDDEGFTQIELTIEEIEL